MEKISAVYQVINTVTNDRYVGSSKNVFHRWAEHKCPSTWKKNPKKKLYQDFQQYGLENFRFLILAPVEPKHLRKVEQEFIEMLKPTYNSMFAHGKNTEMYKKNKKDYAIKWNQTEKAKESRRKYKKSKKYKEAEKKYFSQLCEYNGKTLTLKSLINHFYKAGIHHPNIEAKKYLIK